MSLEDEAFSAIMNHLRLTTRLALLSGHPPSGKSYFGDQVQFPSPIQNRTGARRMHIDILACSSSTLYLCEVKGTSAESGEDIDKLRILLQHYTLDQLLGFVSQRLTYPQPLLKTVSRAVPVIGCTIINTPPAHGFLYLRARENEALALSGSIDSGMTADFSLP